MSDNIDFTIIFPSRGRPHLIKECFQSFFNKAKYPSKIEFWLAFDLDDPTVEEVNKFIVENNYNINYIRVPRTEWLHRDYHNRLVKLAKGNIIIGACDEAEIIQQDWDVIIKSEVEKFLLDKPDKICYIYINDSTHTKSHNFFNRGSGYPSFTKESIETAQCFIPGEIQMWSGDLAVFDVYNSLCENRILDIQDKIQILHKSAHNGTREDDGNIERNRRISKHPHLNAHEKKIYVDRLNLAINKHKFVQIDDNKVFFIDLKPISNVNSKSSLFTGQKWETIDIDPGTCRVFNIPFFISNHIIALHGPLGALSCEYPKEIKIDYVGDVKTIHLLGCIAGWGHQPGENKKTNSVTIELKTKNGEIKHQLINGEHISDFLNPNSIAPKSSLALYSKCGKPIRYMSIPVNNHIESIKFIKDDDDTAPLFFGITIEKP